MPSFRYNEVKGALAKLLATENLIVEHVRCETASFDVDQRVLKLPLWDCSDRVYNMLVGHEVGHALFTPVDDWEEAEVPRSYINVTEDARVEKLMKRKFPGLQKDFYQGYQELNEDDFFGVEDEDPKTLKLIDRINLYYKIGPYSLIPFEPAEESLRDSVGVTETFEEAVKAAVAVYRYEAQKKLERQGTTNPGKTEDHSMFDLGPETGENGQPDKDVNEEAERPRPQPSPQHEPADLDTPSYEQELLEKLMGKEGGETNRDSDEALTDKSLERNLRDISGNQHENIFYCEVPDIDMKKVVVSPDDIREETVNYYCSQQFLDPEHDYYKGKPDWTVVDSEYKKFKRDCSREVNYLVKEFEMKKSAAAYSRETVARTGVLDTAKLHTFKWNTDLFKKITVKPDGKNHGLIFLLDWSGSMAEVILDTYKQLLSLCYFCRKASIPFEVYAFVQDATWNDQIEPKDGTPGNLNIPEDFHLLNFLSSSLNNATFDTYALDVWRVAFVIDSRYGDTHKRGWEFTSQIPYYVPPHMNLCGTPLNEAIACLQTLIPSFQKKNGVEKVHVSILSDGEAQWSNAWQEVELDYTGESQKYIRRCSVRHNTQLRDRKTGKIQRWERGGFTKQLLRYMKSKFPQCNFLGFRICTPREATHYLGQELELAAFKKKHKEWTKNKTVGASILGFQELYFLSTKILNTEVEFEVAEDATKGQIKNAFKKSLKAKANNKKILSSFIKQIA